MTARVLLGLILVVAGGGNPPEPPPAGGAGAERPNVVVVLVDDLRFDEFHAGGHPYQGRYRDRVFTRRQQPREIAADLAGKPVIRHALAKLPTAAGPGPGEHEHAAYPWTGEETIRRRAEMILAVDESLGRIIATLASPPSAGCRTRNRSGTPS